MDPITPESLLARWFWPHYPPDVRAAPFLHRDVDANPGGNTGLNAHAADAAGRFVANAAALLEAPVTLDDAGIGALARALTRARRDAWLAASDPGDPGNLFFNVVVHAALFVGEVIVRRHGGRWELRRPLWESVVHRRGGGAVSPFHWLLKGLADDAVDSLPLAVRWRLHIVQPGADPTTLPVVTAAQRLPPLKSPTYDLLVKYLHAHLEGLRDLGEGFPSPEEFTARAYAALTFTPLQGGRVLAVHGQTRATPEGPGVVDVHWLTAHGHDHTDAIPTDQDVPYFGRALNDDALEVTVGWKGGPHTHRLTLRGHG
jgi:hypothetical protein